MATATATANSEKPVVVREVWDDNLILEFKLICNALIHHRRAAFDTEFPGLTVTLPKEIAASLSPADTYSLMKSNVDQMKIIQFGLSLSDFQGNLPDFGTPFQYIWQFNFRDFDVERDPHNPKSIELLRNQGIDFEKNLAKGIDSARFANMLVRSGLVGIVPIGGGRCTHLVTWATFHGIYDFGLLIKLLFKNLPDDLRSFKAVMWTFFGNQVFDLKWMMKGFHLHGGLEKLANTLEIDRVAGKSHQAGSDSLLTLQAFHKFNAKYFLGNLSCLRGYGGALYGLIDVY